MARGRRGSSACEEGLAEFADLRRCVCALCQKVRLQARNPIVTRSQSGHANCCLADQAEGRFGGPQGKGGRMHRASVATVIGALLLVIPSAGWADPSGSGVLVGVQRLRVKGCGKDTQPMTLSVQVGSDGRWTAAEGGRNYSGSHTPNKKGTRSDLLFDPAAEMLFVDQMENWAGLLCDGSVVAERAVRKKGKLKINAKKGTAKLSVKYKLFGTGPGGPGRAAYAIKVGGSWVPPACSPSCAGRVCGDDGCGGSCGTCAVGTSCDSNGQCQAGTCQEGQSECIAGQVDAVRLCVNGNWTTSACEGASACSRGACRPMCSERDLTSIAPFLCLVPNKDGVNDGILWYSNHPELLGPPTFSDVGQDDGNGASLQVTPSDQAWPYEWSVPTTGYIGIAFKLSQFSAPVNVVRLYYRGKRAGIINQGTTSSRFFAKNADAIIGEAIIDLAYTWRTDNYDVPPIVTPNFYYDGRWNAAQLTVVGDGFGNLPDLLEVNWLTLEITQ